MGYGVAEPWQIGTATPYAGLIVSGGEDTRLRAGVRSALNPDAAMTLEGIREERGADRAEHALMGRIALEW